jgi:hypothetical protein
MRTHVEGHICTSMRTHVEDTTRYVSFYMCSHTSTYVSSGKSFTGGLGHKASYAGEHEYGVWACVRDWDMEEQLACGVGARQLACFRFDERSKQFHLYGTNDELGVCVCVCVCVCVY